MAKMRQIRQKAVWIASVQEWIRRRERYEFLAVLTNTYCISAAPC